MRFVTTLAAGAGLALLAIGGFANAAAFVEQQKLYTKSEVVLHDGTARPVKAEVGTLPAGTQVVLLASWRGPENVWWRVRHGNQTGWLTESSLAEQAPAGAHDAQAERYQALPETLMLQAPTEGEDRREELARLWGTIRNGSVEERARACQVLPYSGHTDTAFFDALDRWLKVRFGEALEADAKVDVDVTRCLQGLASSGNAKYLATLQSWAASPRNLLNKYVRKYLVSRAPVFLSDSSVWNPIINASAEHTGGRDWATTRVINMIKSGSLGLQREGMRRIKRHPRQYPGAFDALDAEIQHADLTTLEPQRQDAIAWQCKTLAESRDPKYAPTLTKAAAASNEKIGRHCQRALDDLDEPPSADEPDEDATKDEAP